jgi:hypothetical protein
MELSERSKHPRMATNFATATRSFALSAPVVGNADEVSE